MVPEPSKSGGSSYFNLFVLRRLFNRNNAGRGLVGEKRRYEFHPTITFATMHALTRSVPTGHGKYSSPVVELSMRLVLCLVGMLSVETVGEELAVALLDRNQAATNLVKLATFITNYAPIDEKSTEEKTS